MGLLDDSMVEAGRLGFVNPDMFGELVTYTPRGGSPRQINAVVQRDPPRQREGTAVGSGPRMIISIARHPTDGVETINVGGDTITLAYRLDDTPRAYQIVGPVRHDSGMFTFELT